MTSIAIAIADVVVRQDSKGRYNLNDFHRAAGEESRHRPSLWAENRQAKDLAAEIAQETGKAGIPALVLQRGGKAPGTYACRELVYAYAMWISPAFHLKVIRNHSKAPKSGNVHLLLDSNGRQTVSLERRTSGITIESREQWLASEAKLARLAGGVR